VGTSASYRSPATPRWSAFVSALLGNEPLDRVRSELFNAGSEWSVALSGPAIASFASTVESLFGEFAERLAGADSPTVVVGEVVAEARAASHDAGFSPATSIAERALARQLLSGLGDARTGAEAAEQWTLRRGATANDAVATYLGEVLAQFAKHVIDREAGRLAERNVGAAASASVSAEIAGSARQVAAVAVRSSDSNDSAATRWRHLVSAAFEAGGALPGRSR
jgi:hypothetical protein